MSFWRNNDVVITSRARRGSSQVVVPVLASRVSCRLKSPTTRLFFLNTLLRLTKKKLQNSTPLTPGPRFNIKLTSYQYRKYHCGDKTILRPSYLHNGISYTGKMSSLYWIRALVRGIHLWLMDSPRASNISQDAIVVLLLGVPSCFCVPEEGSHPWSGVWISSYRSTTSRSRPRTCRWHEQQSLCTFHLYGGEGTLWEWTVSWHRHPNKIHSRGQFRAHRSLRFSTHWVLAHVCVNNFRCLFFQCIDIQNSSSLWNYFHMNVAKFHKWEVDIGSGNDLGSSSSHYLHQCWQKSCPHMASLYAIKGWCDKNVDVTFRNIRGK